MLMVQKHYYVIHIIHCVYVCGLGITLVLLGPAESATERDK